MNRLFSNHDSEMKSSLIALHLFPLREDTDLKLVSVIF